MDDKQIDALHEHAEKCAGDFRKDGKGTYSVKLERRVYIRAILQAASAAPAAQNQTAEDYLRGKYGAYRGHPEWRALEEAFNAGRSAAPDHIPDATKMVGAAPVAWPSEPTPEMQQAGAQAIRFDTTIINKIWTANAVYRAMRAVAPVSSAAQPVALHQTDFTDYTMNRVRRTQSRLGVPNVGQEQLAANLEDAVLSLCRGADALLSALNSPTAAQPVTPFTEDAAFRIAQMVYKKSPPPIPSPQILLSAAELVQFFQVACIDYAPRAQPVAVVPENKDAD